MIRPLARLVSRLAGPHCCDCSCGDCAANGHTCTQPQFGPALRFNPLRLVAGAGPPAGIELANVGDQLDAITALLEDIRNLISYLVPPTEGKPAE